MNVLSRFRFNVAVSWLAHLVEALAAVVLMPYCVRMLGDYTYGYWLFLTAIISHLGLVTFGLGGTITRFAADAFHKGDDAELSRVVSAALLVFGALAGLFAGGGVVAAYFLSPTAGAGHLQTHELQWVAALLGLKTAADLLAIPFGATLFGIRRISLEQSIEIVATLGRTGLVLWLVNGDWGLYWLAVGMAVVSAGRLLLTIAVLFHTVRCLSRPLFREILHTVKSLYRFSRFVFLDCISFTIFQAADNVLIGWFLGPAAIVPYQIASRIAKLAEDPLKRVAYVLMPEANRLQTQGRERELQQLVIKVARTTFLLIGGFFVGAWFFGDNMIRTWIGAGYDSSHIILLILAGQLVVGLPATVIREVMLGCGSIRASSVTNLLMAAINLGLSLALIPQYGAIGAAAGTLIARLLVDPAYMLTMLAHRIELSPSAAVRGIFLRPLAPLAVMAVFCITVDRQFPSLQGWPQLLLVTAGGLLVLLSMHVAWERLFPEAQVHQADAPETAAAGV